jgi:hypothetical protein
MAWTRPPIGNLARQSYEEISGSEGLAALKREFEMQQPGIDCEHCTIKKNVGELVYDDFFFRMLDKTLTT